MKTYNDLVNDSLEYVKELFPWDLVEELDSGKQPIILDIREPYEFEAMHIKNSINVPRGILEASCEYDYEETVPKLVGAREEDVVVVCRSGNRSVLAAHTMQLMGFQKVRSLKTGLRGWNDYELPLLNKDEEPVDIDDADQYFTPVLDPTQLSPVEK